MKFERASWDTCGDASDIVVVIDVLRQRNCPLPRAIR
jgi:hypothetical protein